jgi:beta-glucosidase
MPIFAPFLQSPALSPQTPPYLNLSLSAKERAADLVSRMTLDEKISQMQNTAAPIDRLGVPAYDWWSEALHGPIGSPVTVYPQVIGLAATFDTSLISQIGAAISDEGRARYLEAIAHNRHGMHEGLTFWAPNINIVRDPRWGRGQETYGEDPFLTATMATHYVKAMQGEDGGKLKAVATPKHFAVHSGPDPDRHRFNATPNAFDLWNFYLPAFQSCVVNGGAWSVMSAYSSVDGVPDSANPFLLQQILRDKWGFRGYVVSDCGAIYDIYTGHHYTNNLAEASAAAVKAGCDLECGDAYKHLKEAVQQGLIDEKTINLSVNRLMEARFRLGMFDPPATSGPWKRIPYSVVDSPEHRALALKAARESIVLLKNDGFLPLKNIHKLAVIGPTANDREIPLGNYNGQPSKLATVVDGLKAVAPAGVQVRYTQGSSLTEAANVESIPETALPGGVAATFFSGQDLQGAPLLKSTSPSLDFDWGNQAPAAGVPQTNFSAKFTATLVPPKTGPYLIGTRSDDGARLKIDGKLIEEDWTVHPAKTTTAEVQLEAGHRYQIEVDYFQGDGEASVKLLWSLPGQDSTAEAVKLAADSDAVVMVLGISGALENEELDRKTLNLPIVQQKLLADVLKTGKPVVVVLESGSGIALDPKPLRGLLEAWYPGEEGGTAIAEVLFGKTNPSGKLSETFYKSLDQLPPFDDYKLDGRTYRYMHQTPLYPFGYGLSYTKFKTTLTKIESLHASWQVQATVKNVGAYDGDEVVQVYAARGGAHWPEPTRKLVGFQRVHLRAGESKAVQIEVSMKSVGFADSTGKVSLLDGNYKFSVGGGVPGEEPTTSGKDATAFLVLTARP